MNVGPKANGSFEGNPREFCPGNEVNRTKRLGLTDLLSS